MGRLHQTNLSPAVRSVEQSEEMETSVTQLEWRLMGELRLRPVTASQIYKCFQNINLLNSLKSFQNRRNLTGDSLQDGRQWFISLKGAGIS